MSTGWAYLAGVLITALAGIIVTRDAFSSGWYDSLNKPPLTPPNYIFPIVWTLLYIGIFLAGSFTDRNIGDRGELTVFRSVFALQLLLNFLWSYLFFGQRNIGGALAVNFLLVLVNLYLLSTMARYSRLSFVIFFLYTVWTIYALYLTWGVWSLNPSY
jgi:translocator protein